MRHSYIMPEKDGTETLREIVRVKRDARVVTFRGRSDAEEHTQVVLTLGARRAFMKPFRSADLLAEVCSQLREGRLAGD